MGTATHAILRVLSTFLYTGEHRSACLRFGERIGSAILPGPAWLLLNIETCKTLSILPVRPHANLGFDAMLLYYTKV